MADAEKQELAAEPVGCSRSAAICLVGCLCVTLISIAVFLVALRVSIGDRRDYDHELLVIALLLPMVLFLAGFGLGLFIVLLVERHRGNKKGEMFVDK